MKRIKLKSRSLNVAEEAWLRLRGWEKQNYDFDVCDDCGAHYTAWVHDLGARIACSGCALRSATGLE